MRRNDDLNAARGIINGIAFGLAVWLIILAIFAIAARADMAQPTNLPPVVIVEGEGVGYTAPGWAISLSADLAENRRVYLHELGHHVDYLIPEADPFRYRFRELIADPRPWRTSPNSPHEKFAEAYAMCASKDPATVTLRWLRAEFGYDYRPTVRVHRKVCRTIENAMARYPEAFTNG